MLEPLVLLPGMMCDGRLFGPQLTAQSSRRPVMVIPPVGARSIRVLADQVLQHAPDRFALAGLSMGGIVAMEVIRRAPGRVTRLALLDTNPAAEPTKRVPTRKRRIEAVLAGGLRAVMRDELIPNYLARESSVDRIGALCMEMAEALGAQTFADQSHAIQHRPDQCESLRSVAVPTLVLCGEEDRLCPVSCHRLMHELIPASRLLVIRQAGHLPTLEQPQRTNEALEEWLNL